MCFVFIWEQTATCATYSINWLVFITEMKSVYSAVRTGSLNKAYCYIWYISGLASILSCVKTLKGCYEDEILSKDLRANNAYSRVRQLSDNIVRTSSMKELFCPCADYIFPMVQPWWWGGVQPDNVTSCTKRRSAERKGEEWNHFSQII